MSIEDKVLYCGNVFKIIFDYKNGQYEIMQENLLRRVFLVSENEIIKLSE